MTVRPEFLFLNRLRESGTTNMFGAASFLRDAFDMGRAESQKVLGEWMAWVGLEAGNRDL